MPKALTNLSVTSPGFFGLNKQKSGDILPPGWASVATNLVFDSIGRLSSRKGYKNRHATAVSGSPTVKAIHEYIDASGSSIRIFAAGNAIYKEIAGTVTDISGTITTPTDDNWQFANFNGWCVGFQEGHAPIVLTTVGGTFADSGGTQYNGNMVLSAYGRIWTVESNTLYYSDLLVNSFAGGSSGSFNLASYWKDGMDEAVALADFNGYLVVFGNSNIIVYESPDVVSNMAIVESIGGTGCIARDSVQTAGKDLLFLSRGGVKSLGRVIQEKSMPMQDISKNVRDDLIFKFSQSTADTVKSVYNVEEGFYLLSLPGSSSSFYFDTKEPLQDGSLKATEWNITPNSLMYSPSTGKMYIGTDGFLSEYLSYKDNILSDGTGGSTYSFDYEGGWNDFGEEVSALLKIPKKISLLMAGVAGRTVTTKWAFDYEDSFSSSQISFPSGTVAQYGVSQYGIGTYSGNLTFDRAKANMRKTGQVIKFGVSTTVSGQQVSLQRIDMLAKVGRLAV